MANAIIAASPGKNNPFIRNCGKFVPLYGTPSPRRIRPQAARRSGGQTGSARFGGAGRRRACGRPAPPAGVSPQHHPPRPSNGQPGRFPLSSYLCFAAAYLILPHHDLPVDAVPQLRHMGNDPHQTVPLRKPGQRPHGLVQRILA